MIREVLINSIKTIVLIIFSFGYVVCVQASSGDIYYVSPDGMAEWNECRNNRNSPSSLDSANFYLSAGETAKLLSGTYSIAIHPTYSGTEGNPITYEADTAGTVTISHNNLTLINLQSGEDYITIRNINLYLTGEYREFWLATEADHIVFDGIHTAISGPEVIRYDSHMEQCSDWEIKNCYIDAYNAYIGYITTNVVDLVGISRCTRFYIHDNFFGTALHSCLYIGSGNSYFWITNNTFGNRFRHSMNIQRVPLSYDSPEFILVENNIFDKVGLNSKIHPNKGERRGVHSIELDGVRSVIRNNIYTKCDHGLSNINPNSKSPVAQNWIYHNTIYRTRQYNSHNTSGRSIQLTGYVSNGINNNRILNNIFYYPDNSTDMYIYDGGSGVGKNGFTNNQFENNIIVRADGTFKASYFGSSYTSLASLDNAVDQFKNNIQQLPDMIDPENGNYQLSIGSPAIDNGRFLATVVSINNNQLTIGDDEAYAFTTSWGIPGKPNDSICNNYGVSTSAISVDSHNQITVADASGYSVGDKLTTVNFNGAAPDIGAYEYSGIVGVREINRTRGVKMNVYPNPALNGSISVFYELPYISDVKVDILDETGKSIKTIINKKQEAGKHVLSVNDINCKPGLYFCKLMAGKNMAVSKFIVQ